MRNKIKILLILLAADIIIGIYLITPLSPKGSYIAGGYNITFFTEETKPYVENKTLDGITWLENDIWIRTGKSRIYLYYVCWHEKLHNEGYPSEDDHMKMAEIPVNWTDPACSFIWGLL